MSVEMNSDFELEESASERGVKWLGRIIAIVVVLIVAAFGDVMYITLMQSRFPDGLLLAVCYAGAFTSFLAIVYMLIGKQVLFTPGPQMVTAWFVFGIELTLIALNLCLVFAGDSAAGLLAAWNQLAAATPVFNMAGVAILYFLDESQKMKHEDVEMSWEMKRANRRHMRALAKARLKLQNKQLNFLVTELDRAVAAPESLLAIQQTAIDLNAHLLGQLSGGRTYRAPQISASSASFTPAPDAKIIDEQPEPAKPAKFFDKINPFKKSPEPENAKIIDTPKETPTETIDTSPRRTLRPSLEERKRTRRQQFISAKKEVAKEHPNFRQSQVPIKRNRGAYVVNKNTAKISLND